MNEESKKVAFLRPKIIRCIQNYLDNLGFVEVETPILTSLLTGASARPFVTHHNTQDLDMYLRIALELNLKRLIVGGMEKVFEEETGIKVEIQDGGAGEIFKRIEAEAENPLCDVQLGSTEDVARKYLDYCEAYTSIYDDKVYADYSSKVCDS